MVRIDKTEIKKQVNFSPINAVDASNDSIFVDVADYILKYKDHSGVVKNLI